MGVEQKLNLAALELRQLLLRLPMSIERFRLANEESMKRKASQLPMLTIQLTYCMVYIRLLMERVWKR